MRSNKHAVILAAGAGERLKPYTNFMPKALVHIAGKPILNHIMDALHTGAGVTKFFIVTGYRAGHYEYVKPPKGCDMHFVENKKWKESNSMLSLTLAMDFLAQGGFIVEGDCCFDTDLLKAYKSNYSQWFVRPFNQSDDGCCLRADEHGFIQQLSIEKSTSKHKAPVHKSKESQRRRKSEVPDDSENAFKSCGVLHLTDESAWDLERWLKAAIQERRESEYFDQIIGEHLEKARLRIANIGDARWCEIDDENDLQRAEALFGEQ